MDTAEFGWAVPPGHPAFAGHFPARPIVPGVLLLDHALLLATRWKGRESAPGWRVAQAKFFVPVGPSEPLRFVLQATPRGSIAFSVRLADGREAASGSLVPPAAA